MFHGPVIIGSFSPWQRSKAALSLQTAARRFLKKHRKMSAMDHVRITSACEIDKACQEVLGATYGHCCFEDIVTMDMGKKVCYCTTHKKNCVLEPDLEDTNRTNLSRSFPNHTAPSFKSKA